jgi:RNA polymerase sigma-70 factor (ECF subfamily)
MQGREGYAPIATICVYRGGVGWCMGGAEIGTVAREGDECRQENSLAGRRGRKPALRLVASSGSGSAADRAAGAGSGTGKLDWSRLMGRAQDGDREAYRALLEDMAPYLRSLTGRCFKESADIEDAVQDILLTVHAVRHAYDPRRPFGPWLVAIANRRIIDRLRRQTRAKFREIELTAEHETFSVPPANLSSNLSEVSVNEAALHEAIENLPPEQRQAIRLLKLKEMSLKEAAAKTGRSISALKVATHRAIKSLRKMLQREDKIP